MYWWSCGNSPAQGWVTVGNGNNIRRHRKSTSSKFDPAQRKINDRPKPKTLSTQKLIKIILQAVISCNLPYHIVKNRELVSLITNGTGRKNLQYPSSMSVSCDIRMQYDVGFKNLQESLSTAISKIPSHLTCGQIEFLAAVWPSLVTCMTNEQPYVLHFFSKRIWRTYSITNYWCCVGMLTYTMGENWRSKLQCPVTDGAANVSSASQMLGLSRRCLQHSFVLVKHL